MLRISKLTDYAVVLLAKMAEHTGIVTVASLHTQTGVPAPTAAKILKKLAKAGLVQATRGAAGGYMLARAKADINVVHILEAMDGPMAITDCAPGSLRECSVSNNCQLQPNWVAVNNVIKSALSGLTLDNLVCQKNTGCHTTPQQAQTSANAS